MGRGREGGYENSSSTTANTTHNTTEKRKGWFTVIQKEEGSRSGVYNCLRTLPGNLAMARQHLTTKTTGEKMNTRTRAMR